MLSIGPLLVKTLLGETGQGEDAPFLMRSPPLSGEDDVLNVMALPEGYAVSSLTKPNETINRISKLMGFPPILDVDDKAIQEKSSPKKKKVRCQKKQSRFKVTVNRPPHNGGRSSLQKKG